MSVILDVIGHWKAPMGSELNIYGKYQQVESELFGAVNSSRVIFRIRLDSRVVENCARRYGFYVRVPKTISHEWAQRTSEILFLTQEHQSISSRNRLINVLFIIWTYSEWQKYTQRRHVNKLRKTSLRAIFFKL
jgi:hypothetical protein